MKLSYVTLLSCGLMLANTASAEKWYEAGKSLMANVYVDMDSFVINPNNDNPHKIAYRNKLVSRSDNAGLAKGNAIVSNVVDNCDTHEQILVDIGYFDAAGKIVNESKGSRNFPLDRLVLKTNTAQYIVHYELCQGLFDSEKKRQREQFAKGVVKPTVEVIAPDDGWKDSQDGWRVISEDNETTTEIKLDSIKLNEKNKHISFISRETVSVGEGKGSGKTVQGIANCVNDTQMRLSESLFNAKGREIRKKRFSSREATYKPALSWPNAAQAQDYLCSMLEK